MVAFKERYQAEKFMFAPWTIPSVGDVQLSWLPNPPVTVPSTMAPEKNGTGEDEQDTAMDSAPAFNETPAPPRKGPQDMDYDVAEDEGW